MKKNFRFHSSQSKNNDADTLKGIVKDIFPKLTGIFVAVGFLIILVYSGQIGYMPIFDINSFTTVLIAVAVAAIFFTFLTAIVLLLPGAYWRFLIGIDNDMLRSIKLKNFAETALFVSPYFFFPTASCFFFFFVLVSMEWIYLVPTIVFQGIFIWFVRCRANDKEQNLVKEWAVYNSAGVATAIAFLLPAVLINSKLAEDVSIEPVFRDTLTYIYLLFVVLLNICIASFSTSKVKLKTASTWVLFSFLAVFGGTGMASDIPEKAMALYKFGALKNVSLPLTHEGCTTLALLDEIEAPEKGGCLLESVNVLSKLGTEHYVELDGRRFPIKSEQVLTWAPERETDENSDTSETSPGTEGGE